MRCSFFAMPSQGTDIVWLVDRTAGSNSYGNSGKLSAAAGKLLSSSYSNSEQKTQHQRLSLLYDSRLQFQQSFVGQSTLQASDGEFITEATPTTNITTQSSPTSYRESSVYSNSRRLLIRESVSPLISSQNIGQQTSSSSSSSSNSFACFVKQSELIISELHVDDSAM